MNKLDTIKLLKSQSEILLAIAASMEGGVVVEAAVETQASATEPAVDAAAAKKAATAAKRAATIAAKKAAAKKAISDEEATNACVTAMAELNAAEKENAAAAKRAVARKAAQEAGKTIALGEKEVEGEVVRDEAPKVSRKDAMAAMQALAAHQPGGRAQIDSILNKLTPDGEPALFKNVPAAKLHICKSLAESALADLTKVVEEEVEEEEEW